MAHLLAWGTLMKGSHYLLWAVAFIDKKKKTISIGYSTIIAKYGHPIKVRSDCVAKHSFVPEDMECVKPNMYKPYLTSSLVHN